MSADEIFLSLIIGIVGSLIGSIIYSRLPKINWRILYTATFRLSAKPVLTVGILAIVLSALMTPVITVHAPPQEPEGFNARDFINSIFKSAGIHHQLSPRTKIVGLRRFTICNTPTERNCIKDLSTTSP
jgi:uncharacterized membrane protein YeaQ/YmgE (transglycosylase-associated protein family)